MVVENINIAKKCSFPVDGSEENKLKTIVVSFYSCDIVTFKWWQDKNVINIVKAKNLQEFLGTCKNN